MNNISLAALTLIFSGTLSAAQQVAPGNMPAYCRGEAASQFQTKPTYIKTQKLKRTASGGYLIKGTADLGDEGMKPFECEYDKKGHFLRFGSLVDEGGL